MKYISRLTALLLAMVLLMTSAGAELTLDGLTQNQLDALYTAASDEVEYMSVTGVLGAVDSITSNNASAWADLGYSLQWYEMDAEGALTALTGQTTDTISFTYTLEEQRFTCIATDGDGLEYNAPVYVVQAQTTDMSAYLNYLFEDQFYTDSGDVDMLAVYECVAGTWNVTVEDGNLAENVVAAWWAERLEDYFDLSLMCSCVVTGAAEAENCMLHPYAVHVGTCGWYTAATVAEDEVTGITVTGDIPADVTLEVTAATGPMPEMDTRHFNALRNYPIITGYNITLLNKDGSEYEVPEGTTVRVKIPNAWLADMEYPVVDVYHVKDDGEVVYMTSQLDEVVLADDGSAYFETDGFSEYWITSGSKYTDYFQNGSSHVFYMVPGTEAQVGSYKWLYEQQPGNSWIKAESTNPSVVSASEADGTIYISAAADAQPDQDNAAAVVTISWHGWDWVQSATVTVYIISEQEKEEINYHDKFGNQAYPVQLTIRTDGTIPNEPCIWDGVEYTYFKKGNGDAYVVCGSNEYFANTANGVIKESILDHELFYYVSRDGKPVIGMVDPTGVAIKQMLENIDWDAMLSAAATSNKIYGFNENGVKELITSSNYQDYHVVPYVVKCQETDGKGWHIDCAVVRNGAVHLSYDLNIPDGMTIATQGVIPPNNQTGTAPAEFTVDAITGMTDGTHITVSPDYKFTFIGWNTKEDGTGDWYQPDGSITITEDTTLYAIWNITPEIGTGNLKVRKVVNDAQASAAETFTFRINIPVVTDEEGTPKAYSYILYGADNVAVKDADGEVVSGTVSNGSTFSLQNGQYVIITGLPIAAKAEGSETYTPNVTVTETICGDYTPAWTGGTASGTSASIAIRDGSMSELTCTNAKAAANSTLTIKKEGMQAGESAIVKVTANGQTYMLTLNREKSSATIVNLPIDSSYTVEEVTSWSWQYTAGTPVYTTASKKIVADASQNLVTITNTQEKDKWLHDESCVTNDFKNGQSELNNE